MANPNSLEAFDQKVRSYVDTNYSRFGIDWRERGRLGTSGFADYVRSKLAATLGPEGNWDARQRTLYTNLLRGSDILAKGVNGIDTRDTAFIQALGDSPDDTLNAQRPENAPQEQIDPREAERGNLTKWITEFTQSMGRQVDMNDPVFASLSNMGAARASMGVGQSGIRVGRGGLGEAAIQQGANNAVLPYLQQRIQMQQRGLGMLDSRQRGIEQLQQGAQSLEMQRIGMQNGINQQMYGQQADQAGGQGGIWGGVLGGLAGAGLAVATGGATAAAIPGMIQGGSQLGAGVGMGGVQRPQMQSPRPYGSFGGGGRGGYT